MLAYLKYILIGKRGSAAEYESFELEMDEQGIAPFTTDRSGKMNALNDKSWVEINDFLFWANQSDEVKVAIIIGAGSRAFTAGADLNSLKVKKPMDCLGGAGQKTLNRIQKCSKPVTVAVNGYAFGGGCETAIARDFRVVSEDALFALLETELGILPGAGGTQRLSRLIGLGRAMDAILMGRKIGTEEAIEIGLATKCVPQWELLLETRKMASKLIVKESVALRIAKQVVIVSFPSSQEIEELLEMLALSTLCDTEDKTEGVSPSLEKRTSDYRGR